LHITFKGKFSKNVSERIHRVTETHFVCKFRENWLTGNQQSLPDKKKQNFRKVSSSHFCEDRAQNLSGLQTIYSEFPKFHPNPFTSGGVISERVNIVETRHKVFPILGEASLPSN